MSYREYSTTIPTVLPRGFVVIDTETTGLHAEARIIELGVVYLSSRGNIQKTFNTLLFGDGTTGEWFARMVHGIKKSELDGAPQFKHIASDFLESLEGRIVFAHNASFDLKRINYELKLARRRRIRQMACTMQLGVHLGYGRMKLDKAVEEFGLFRQISHHALFDALVTSQLLQFYLSEHPREVREYLTKLDIK
jgi:DNA polymerase-3 subunit epsilon